LSPPNAKVIFQRYANGELTAEEMVEEVRASNAREFGPVPISGNCFLRNIADLRESLSLAAFEANATIARLLELAAEPPGGRFDVPHLNAIHRQLFQMCIAGPVSSAP